MEKWEEAYSDYKKGLKYREIAEKYGVSLNTVKSWKVRFWNSTQSEMCARKAAETSKSVHTKIEKGVQKSEEETAHTPEAKAVLSEKNNQVENTQTENSPKRGAPKGNQNAIGNRGGAPEGNANNLKHGLFSKLNISALNADEYDYLMNGEIDPARELALIAKLGNIRIKRFHERMTAAASSRGGLVIKGVTKTKYENDRGESESTTTQTEAADELVIRYSDAIGRIEKNNIRCLEMLKNMCLEEQKDEKAERNVVNIYLPDNKRGV